MVYLAFDDKNERRLQTRRASVFSSRRSVAPRSPLRLERRECDGKPPERRARPDHRPRDVPRPRRERVAKRRPKNAFDARDARVDANESNPRGGFVLFCVARVLVPFTSFASLASSSSAAGIASGSASNPPARRNARGAASRTQSSGMSGSRANAEAATRAALTATVDACRARYER